MIDNELLSILACPETKKDLELVTQETIDKVNQLIEEGKLSNRAKEKITKKIDGGLFRKGDNNFLYPIRNNIPILLVDELISLEGIS